MKQQMTIVTLIRSMFNGINAPLSEDDYKLLQIPKYRYFKRKEFSNIYKTILLYLTRLSIPKAFPNNHKRILSLFDRMWNHAYINDPSIKKVIDADLKAFESVSKNTQFLPLAQHIVERFEKRPRKALFISLLNDRIGYLYGNYCDIGNRVELIENAEEEQLVNNFINSESGGEVNSRS